MPSWSLSAEILCKFRLKWQREQNAKRQISNRTSDWPIEFLVAHFYLFWLAWSKSSLHFLSNVVFISQLFTFPQRISNFPFSLWFKFFSFFNENYFFSGAGHSQLLVTDFFFAALPFVFYALEIYVLFKSIFCIIFYDFMK